MWPFHVQPSSPSFCPLGHLFSFLHFVNFKLFLISPLASLPPLMSLRICGGFSELSHSDCCSPSQGRINLSDLSDWTAALWVTASALLVSAYSPVPLQSRSEVTCDRFLPSKQLSEQRDALYFDRCHTAGFQSISLWGEMSLWLQIIMSLVPRGKWTHHCSHYGCRPSSVEEKYESVSHSLQYRTRLKKAPILISNSPAATFLWFLQLFSSWLILTQFATNIDSINLLRIPHRRSCLHVQNLPEKLAVLTLRQHESDQVTDVCTAATTPQTGSGSARVRGSLTVRLSHSCSNVGVYMNNTNTTSHTQHRVNSQRHICGNKKSDKNSAASEDCSEDSLTGSDLDQCVHQMAAVT